jgi:glycosyltransferase involved in cell wall biosynthesis
VNVLQVSDHDLVSKRYNGYDLLDALEPYGVQGRQAVLKKWSDDPRVVELLRDAGDLMLHSAVARVEARQSLDDVLYPWAQRLARTPEFGSSDVVHYHTLHVQMLSLLDLPMLFSAKPSVWTLHDPWPLTGHCVHPEACTGWLTGCSPCPHLDRYFPMREDKAGAAFELKREVYSRLDVDIVVASEFMLDMVRRSPLTSAFERVHLIPFGVDTALFGAHHDKASIRRELGIAEDDFVLLFRATEWPIKGLSYIIEALSSRPPARPTTLLTVEDTGLLKSLSGAYTVLDLGRVEDDVRMAQLFAAADVFLMPSTAESFGLMAVEAMASSRPVICFQDTAVETVTHAPECGVAVPWRDATALREAIDRLMANPAEATHRGELGRKIVEQEYAYERYLDDMAAVYEKVLQRHGPCNT